jgi:DNA-binding NtrC family response regulator
LWDRRRKKLLGRPALGVQGDQLEVDDNSGVVGEVLASGEARIWNGGSDDESRVNRKVDRSLAFQTRSLVAVPMSGPRDGVIGVFEAINHRGDGFDEEAAQLLADLAKHAAVAIQVQRTRRQLTEARDRLVNDAASTAHLIGNDPKIDAVRRASSRVAKTDLTVLVLGRNGTGKEVLARYIHFESQRRSGPFIAVNCAALVETLLESELFGHERGAFTDAHTTRAGKFELATGGTLFLDEVGDMSPGGQAKLLRVLEEKIVVRVGGSQPIPVDVRVIAATNQPLDELIRQKRFREDLFFRLNVVSLSLPPLAERGDDVLVLAEHFLQQFCYQIGRQIPQLLPSAKQTLKSHSWPGNIRELRNTIERVTYLCMEDQIGADDLMLMPIAGSRHEPSTSNSLTTRHGTLAEVTQDFQVEYIQRAIDVCEGNMTDAAARLGLHRSNLYRKMKQLGMPAS